MYTTTEVTLRAIGIPDHISGFRYIKTALELLYKHPEMLRNITRELYPAIASSCGAASACGVERGIRYAIAWAFDNADPDLAYEMFGNTIKKSTGLPTNKQFLCTLYNYLKHETARH